MTTSGNAAAAESINSFTVPSSAKAAAGGAGAAVGERHVVVDVVVERGRGGPQPDPLGDDATDVAGVAVAAGVAGVAAMARRLAGRRGRGQLQKI